MFLHFIESVTILFPKWKAEIFLHKVKMPQSSVSKPALSTESLNTFMHSSYSFPVFSY